MVTRPVHIQSLAGIKRDGTRLQGDYYIDGQWCRFQRGLPRKMGGYVQISTGLSGLSRGMYTFSANNNLYTHVGSGSALERLTIAFEDGIASTVTNRTPASFAASANNMWSMDALFDPVTTQSALVAHAAPNLSDISSTVNRPIYIGSVTDTAALIALGGTSPSVSGGICVLHPYIFAYGNAGYIAWSAPDDPTDWTAANGGGAANVTSQKIVYGVPTRGGPANSPAGLFWSLDSVIRATYTGQANVYFSFDTISDESSILSAQGVIEYDGVYYWAGVDRFLMYNGVVREVANSLNINWFYDNLNFEQRQKVFAFKVPRWGEIWWCFPYGDATECTHAVILNIREQCWYDTVLPNGGRCDGQYARAYQYPLMIGTISINSIQTLDTLVGGSLYTNGTYYNVNIINTSNIAGINATANITVSGGAVTAVTIVNGGEGYNIGDVLTVKAANIGGTGSGFTIKVATLNGYSLWRHEYGVDEIKGSVINPILSYFVTSDISVAAAEQSKNKSLRVAMIEPDFVQSGDMSVEVTGRANARAPEVTSDPQIFPETPQTPQEQVVYFKDIRRQMRFKFISNTVGGNYQMGLCLAHIEEADGTVLG